jgi:signal transduction histidine kinase
MAKNEASRSSEINLLESQMLVPLNLVAILVYAVLAVAMPVLEGTDIRRMLSLGSVVLLFVLSLLACRQQKLRLASWLNIAGLLAAFVLTVPGSGGISAPGISAIVFPILVAGYLIGRREMLALAAILIVYTFVLAYLQATDRLPSPLLTHSPWSRAFIHSMLVVAIVSVAWYALLVVGRTQAKLQEEVVERRKAEDEVRRMNLQLEQRVAERTADLGSFTSMVSHDLRGPVRHAQGYARMLVEDKGDQLDDEAREYLDRIVHSAYRMNALIDDLLTLSRIGVKPIQLSEVDMKAVAVAAADIATHQGTTKVDIQISDLGGAQGDAGLLRVVWENLIGNAVKFTKTREHPQIRIGSEEREGRAWYWIEDNGVGFDQTYVGKVFEVFERLHSNDEFKGSGVGLSTVRRIVEKHGGEVRASGKVDQGARFEFTLTGAPPSNEATY